MADARACERCGALFTPRREHSRFCSAGCRVAANRDSAGGEPPAGSALEWSVAEMSDTIRRLSRARPAAVAEAVAVLSEAVWSVTIVDATLIRYYPAAYDAALAREPGARIAEQTLAGLRYVRNRIGCHAGPLVLIQPPGEPAFRAAKAPVVAAWRWRALPEPALTSLPPTGREWELSRYHAYQARLAGHRAGQAFTAAGAFLRAVSAGALSCPGLGRPLATRP